jgi:tetratricopeptide (TPR) repeat protein
LSAQQRLLTLSDLMLPFRRSQSRWWGGALKWFHGFDGAGLWYRRRGAGHDADGTVVDALTKIDRDTIILKRRAGPAPIKFPNPHIGARIFEVPNSHRYCDHKIVMTSSGAPCLAGPGVRDSQFAAAQSISHFARALGAARSGNAPAARAELAHLDEIEAKLATAKDDYWAGQTRIQKQAAAAWVTLSEGERDEAIAAMRKAADLDDASEKNVAMENKLVPIRALLGELYLAVGMSKEALVEFEASQKVVPNRFRTLAGAAKAARDSGSVETIGTYHELVTRARESGDHTEVLEPRIGEVPQHGCFRRILHGESVVRALPAPCLSTAASRADLAADILRGFIRVCV